MYQGLHPLEYVAISHTGPVCRDQVHLATLFGVSASRLQTVVAPYAEACDDTKLRLYDDAERRTSYETTESDPKSSLIP